MAKQSKKKKCLFGLLCLFANQNPQQQLSINSAVATPRAGKPGSADTPAAALAWTSLSRWVGGGSAGCALIFKDKSSSSSSNITREVLHVLELTLTSQTKLQSWLEIHNPTKQVIGAEPGLLKLATLKEAKTESTL